MSLTYNQAVEQTITAGEQIHQIVNGTATTEVTVEDGSKVPSVRKALLDNFYFKDPISWQEGQTETVFNQLRQFTDGSWWYAPSATASNPISMGSTPVGNSLWKVYDFDAIGKLTPQLREALRRSYAEAGYNLVYGSFEAGGTVTTSTDVLLFEADGKAYSWDGVLPKVVAHGSAPTQIATGAWVLVGDTTLREDLAEQSGAGLVGGLPVFVTATKYAGGAIASSTSNDAAIIAAINDAISTGSYVYWPAVYEVQGNIPNFHSVRHDGPGGIKRGNDTFRVHQLEWSSINQVYCSASGTAGGDGLTSDLPIIGLQNALDAIGNFNPVALQLGLFKLNLSAGTYSKATFSRQIQFINRVEIAGPAPSVAWGDPTAIIDGMSQPGIGLYLQGGSRWKVSHITARNFTGSTGQGICIENGNLWAYNVRAHGNQWVGLNANFSCRLYVSGGDFYSNGHGIRTYGLTTYTVGYDATQPTIVRDNTIGFLAQNACEGHFDNATSTNNDTGVMLLNQSRAHLSGATVTGNNIGVSASNSSSYIKSSGTVVSGNSSFDEICRGFSVSNEDTNICVYNPANRSLVFDSGLSGLTPNSGYKYSYNFSPSDVGVQYLTANSTFSITAGNSANKVAGSLRYTFSDNTWRFINAGQSAFVVSQSAIRPWTDNTMSFGAAAYRSSVVYSATGAINTSDSREKTTPLEISNALLDVADDISIDVWKWLSSIREKGEDAARWHFGPIAQQVRDAFVKHGLNGCDYGLLCYDKWDDQFEDVLDENGDSTGDKRLVLSAGDRWGIRPDQCLWLKMAAVERRANRAEERLSVIEARIAALEEK